MTLRHSFERIGLIIYFTFFFVFGFHLGSCVQSLETTSSAQELIHDAGAPASDGGVPTDDYPWGDPGAGDDDSEQGYASADLVG